VQAGERPGLHTTNGTQVNIKTTSAAAFILCLVSLNHSNALAQSSANSDEADARKVEVGAQFTAVRVDNDPIAISDSARRNEPGVGSRLAYDFSRRVALDVGGVVEYYPSRRTILRLDLGDTVVRYAGIPVFDSNRGLINVTEYQHNFQAGAGFGFRF